MIIKKIKKEYKRFINKEFKKLNGNYLNEPLLCHWSDGWKNYYIKNYTQIEDKMKSLKKDLDEESRECVDLIFTRNVFVKPWEKYADNFLYNFSNVFTKTEKKYQSYLFPEENQKFLKEVFYFDNGLKFLSPNIINYISNKDFIDGGAFIGDTALIFTKYNHNKIYCFEPSLKNSKILEETIKLNNAQDIFIENMALGSKEGQLNFSEEKASSRLNNDKINENVVKVTTIDEFTSQNNLKPGLIKLDVEGSEYEVLKGSVNTIKKHEPVLVISIYHRAEDFFEIKPFIESITPNYKFLIRNLNPDYFVGEVVLIAYPKS